MIFIDDLEYPEAPVLMNDGSWLIAEMAMGSGRLTRVSATGDQRQLLAETGRPNGLLLDSDGSVWVAESWQPSLLKISPKGDKQVVLQGCGNQPFLWPNDLVFGPDGSIYMTDSGIEVSRLIGENGLDEKVWHDDMNGCLYRIDPVTHQIECIDDGYRFANGLAFGPDGGLYVNEMVTGNVYRYDFSGKVVPHSRTLFASVIDSGGPSRVVGPDGMAFDSEGNLFVCIFGQGHLAVVSPDGSIDRSIVTRGSCPTNVAFGPAGSQSIYVTEFQRGRVETYRVDHDAYELFTG